MSTHNLEAQSPLVTSEHEEQVWLLQQQNPERVGHRLSVWKLDRPHDAFFAHTGNH